jgi:hypothetical protein
MICGKSDRGIHARSKQTDFISPAYCCADFFVLFYFYKYRKRQRRHKAVKLAGAEPGSYKQGVR